MVKGLPIEDSSITPTFSWETKGFIKPKTAPLNICSRNLKIARAWCNGVLCFRASFTDIVNIRNVVNLVNDWYIITGFMETSLIRYLCGRSLTDPRTSINVWGSYGLYFRKDSKVNYPFPGAMQVLIAYPYLAKAAKNVHSRSPFILEIERERRARKWADVELPTVRWPPRFKRFEHISNVAISPDTTTDLAFEYLTDLRGNLVLSAVFQWIIPW
jgi:hypothetical protein